MSSTHSAISGYQSLTQMPDWPYCLNFRWLASSGVYAVFPMAVFGPRKTVGQRLAGQLVQLRLGIEQIEMTRSAVEKTPNHRLRLGRKYRRLGRERIDRRFARCSATRPMALEIPSRLSSDHKRQRAKAAAGARQKITPGVSTFVMRDVLDSVRVLG